MQKIFWTIALILVSTFPLLILNLGSLESKVPEDLLNVTLSEAQNLAMAELVRDASKNLAELDQTEVNLLSVRGEVLKLNDKRSELVEKLKQIEAKFDSLQVTLK